MTDSQTRQIREAMTRAAIPLSEPDSVARSARVLRTALTATVSERGITRPGRQWFPHPFPARMPLEVAKVAVDRFTSPGDTVLDPMSGSGVVPFAAAATGRRGVGRDIDPLAVLLGRALCVRISPAVLDTYLQEIHREANARARHCRSPSPRLKRLCEEDQEFLRYWFKDQALIEMFALADAIVADATNPLSGIGAVVLSSLVISRGSGVSLALDLARSRPHRSKSKQPRMPLEFWSYKSAAFTKFYLSNRLGPSAGATEIELGDARQTDLPDGSIDAVVTSPPYINAIDYIRTSKFSLIFLGSQLAALRQIRSQSIGTEVGLPEGVLGKHLDRLVRSKVSDAGRHRLIRRYLFDLSTTLGEMYRVLRPGGRALFALGPSVLSRRTYDSAEVFSLLAREAGFSIVGAARRDLSAANRSLPAPFRGRQRKALDHRMSCEYFVALSKLR